MSRLAGIFAAYRPDDGPGGGVPEWDVLMQGIGMGVVSRRNPPEIRAEGIRLANITRRRPPSVGLKEIRLAIVRVRA